MADNKPYASLSSGLLARKGGAKPAMRPQGFNNFGGNGLGAGSLEDLGWNDMGPDDEFHNHQSPIGLTPASRGQAPADEGAEEAPFHAQPHFRDAVFQPDAADEEVFEAHSSDGYLPEGQAYDEEAFDDGEEDGPPLVRGPLPPVVRQQRALRESFAEAEVVELPRRRPAAAGGRSKAAFTLRLDPERHLKLRLASAVTRLSAQQLVTGALDEYLNSLPDVNALADRVPAGAGQRSR